MHVISYSKRHNIFLFPTLAGVIYGSSCKAENEISNVVNYKYRNSFAEILVEIRVALQRYIRIRHSAHFNGMQNGIIL